MKNLPVLLLRRIARLLRVPAVLPRYSSPADKTVLFI